MNPSKLAVALAASLFLAAAHAQDKGPSDPQIAGIVVTANRSTSTRASSPSPHTKNKEVSKFAQLMITDHTAVNKQAGALARKLGVTPEDSATARA